MKRTVVEKEEKETETAMGMVEVAVEEEGMEGVEGEGRSEDDEGNGMLYIQS